MSIGLDFVKKVDKDWKKHVKPLDLTPDKIRIMEDHDDFTEEDEVTTEMEHDRDKFFWKYWKNYYLR